MGIDMQTVQRMQLIRIAKASVNAAALLLSPFWVGAVFPQSTDAQTKLDNSAVNRRDQSSGAVTADKQKMNAVDRPAVQK